MGDLTRDSGAFKLHVLRENDGLVTRTAKKLAAAGNGMNCSEPLYGEVKRLPNAKLVQFGRSNFCCQIETVLHRSFGKIEPLILKGWITPVDLGQCRVLLRVTLSRQG